MVACESLEDFFVKTTVAVEYSITVTGVDDVSYIPDIRNDTVRMMLKKNIDDPDSEAPLNELADVTTNGANGGAIFVLTPDITNIPPTAYYFEAVWTTQAGEIHPPLDSGQVSAKRRVADV